jgi:hypothetical protein
MMARATPKEVSQEYTRWAQSSALKRLTQVAHGAAYCGQTSSATEELTDTRCGNGCFAIVLAQHHGFVAHAIDLSAELVHGDRRQSTMIRRRWDEAGIRFV